MDSWFELSGNFGPVQILITEQNIRFNIWWCLTAACDCSRDCFLIKYQTKKKEIKINNDDRAMHWFNLNLGPKILSPGLDQYGPNLCHLLNVISNYFLNPYWSIFRPWATPGIFIQSSIWDFWALFLQKPNSSENFDSWVFKKSDSVTSQKTEISEKILDGFSRICQSGLSGLKRWAKTNFDRFDLHSPKSHFWRL